VDKVEESIAFLREHEPEEGYFVGFSGGKDSIVLYDLVKRSGVKAFPYYNQVGIEPPELLKFIKETYPEVKIMRPKEGFFRILRRTGFYPTMWRRWCCDTLKKGATKDIPLKMRLMGVRAEESEKRRKLGRINVYHSKKFHFTIYNAIFDWLEWEIWDYIDDRQLPYLSLYDEGFDRIGCVICPFISGKRVEVYRARWPKIYYLFEKLMREIWERNTGKRKGTEWEDETFEQFMSGWYKSDWRRLEEKREQRRKEIEALGPPKKIKTLAEVEKDHIIETLNYGRSYDWDKVKVAEELGMGFKTLYRKIEEYQLIVSGEMWYAGQEGM